MQYLYVFLVILALIALVFIAIGIKMFVKKDGQFERRCENEGSAHCICGGGECKRKNECNKRNNI